MGDKVKEIPVILCGLLPTFVLEGDATFHLEVSKKKKCISSLQFTGPLRSIHRSLGEEPSGLRPNVPSCLIFPLRWIICHHCWWPYRSPPKLREKMWQPVSDMKAYRNNVMNIHVSITHLRNKLFKYIWKSPFDFSLLLFAFHSLLPRGNLCLDWVFVVPPFVFRLLPQMYISITNIQYQLPAFKLGLNDFSLCESCNLLFTLDIMCVRFTHVNVWDSVWFCFKALWYPVAWLHHGLVSYPPVDGHLDCFQGFDMTVPCWTLLWVSPAKMNFSSCGMAGS